MKGNPVKMDFPTGFPDLLVITDIGKCMFIETKIHPRKPTQEQIRLQENLRTRGFISTTIYSLKEFINEANALMGKWNKAQDI